MPVTVAASVDGIDNVLAAFGAMADGVLAGGPLADSVTNIADEIIADARSNAPVAATRTPPGHEPGTLRDKGIGKNVIHYSDTGLTTAYIGFTFFGWYGIFSEFGTVNQSAQPFILPAFERHRQVIIDAIGHGFFETVMGRFV